MYSQISFSQLKVDFLRAARAPLSQKKWNQVLGFKFNQVLKWETHQKNFNWSDFCFVCEKANLPLSQLLQKHFNILSNDYHGSTILSLILKYFYPNQSLDDVALEMNLHVSCLRRWQRKVGEPDIEFIFKLLYFKNLNFLSFIKELIEDKIVFLEEKPKFLQLMISNKSLTELHSLIPSLCAIQSSFYLKSYDELPIHSDSFIAEKSGVSIDLVQIGINKLIDTGILKFNLETKKYLADPELSRIDMNDQDIEVTRALVSYWTQRSLLRFSNSTGKIINTKKTPNLISYRIAPFSKSSQEKVNELLLQTNQKILEIIEKDPNPMDDVRIVLIHHFSAEDVPK